MTVLSTRRLALRELTTDDAPFVHALYNDAAFKQYIGDRGVGSLSHACDYIVNNMQRSYRDLGFGLWMVQWRERATPLGVCGLVKRDYLPDADLGFAMLPDARGQGVTQEAAQGVLDYAAHTLAMRRICAIVQPDNPASIHVLEKLGFAFDRAARRSTEEIELRIYAYWSKNQETP